MFIFKNGKVIVCFFFVSSRRRHTRCYRDWSSDVCSSDLISRFTVERQAPHRCDPKSEQVIIEWRSAGHDGGGIVFGHDRMLYISTGDGTSDSDGWVTGQDLSDLLGGVLRVEADHP